MKDALDWRNPEVAGVWSDMFRDPVKLYEQKFPDSELPKKFRKLARIKIGIVLLFVIEVAVLQR